jgi:late competence protein required for DNA uptake (superfamily II DNA/RNA helicase)
MKTRVRYRRARVTVEYDRKGYCESCYKVGRTELHHMIYHYKTSEVRANPSLVLENTIELCFKCHRIANMLNHLISDLSRVALVCHAVSLKLMGGFNEAENT